VDECEALEKPWPKRLVGSNPTPSAVARNTTVAPGQVTDLVSFCSTGVCTSFRPSIAGGEPSSWVGGARASLVGGYYDLPITSIKTSSRRGTPIISFPSLHSQLPKYQR
jgi:hypothetical protein